MKYIEKNFLKNGTMLRRRRWSRRPVLAVRHSRGTNLSL